MAFALLDFIFPTRCVLCLDYLDRGLSLCLPCRRRIVLNKTFFCGRCGAKRYSARGICHRDFPYSLAAAGSYEDPALKTLIRSLKFSFNRSAAETAGGILANYMNRLKDKNKYDLILPIPLGKKRCKQRGFNQSELIAKAFARRTPPGNMSLQVRTDLLKRHAETRPQSGLQLKTERLQNIHGCFAVTDKALEIKGSSIILLDDVTTTGATLLEASMALKQSGASRILALTVARA